MKKQLLLWDTFLEWRIKLQKLLVASNSLPQSEIWSAVSSAGDQEFHAAQSHAVHQLSQLSAALTGLGDVLLDEDSFLFGSADKQGENDDDEVVSDIGSGKEDSDAGDEEADSSQSESEADQPIAGAAGKRKTDPLTNSCPHDRIKRMRDEVIDEWYERTRFTTAGTRKGMESFEQPPTVQIKQIMSDEKRLLRRTQLRRSHYPVIGKTAAADADANERGSKEQDYDPEVFDDDDFYHQLLRELIDSKTGDSTDSMTVTRKWLEIQKLRSRMKKKVDTRASKGRKLRFETHKELLNFMAPITTFHFTEEAKDELFSSLFQ